MSQLADDAVRSRVELAIRPDTDRAAAEMEELDDQERRAFAGRR